MLTKTVACQTQTVYILLAFSLIIIALLITVSIYCYLLKYLAKQKIFITLSHHKLQIKRSFILTNVL